MQACWHARGLQLLAAPQAPGLTRHSPVHANQGCVVRKAWVRANFKIGGSVRRLQLAPGAGGRLGARRRGVAVGGAWRLCLAESAARPASHSQLCPCTTLPLHTLTEVLYPSGLFRKPLRFAVRRAVVNAPAWRTGAYLVLDTSECVRRAGRPRGVCLEGLRLLA